MSCCRPKSVESFVKKATGKAYPQPFTEIEDQVAARVIVFFLSDIETIERKLLSHMFQSFEMATKHPSGDDAFGYESRHLVVHIPGIMKPPSWPTGDSALDWPTSMEIQLRTVFMHAWAEPEHLFYKDRSRSPDRRLLAWIAASAWGADKSYEELRARFLGEDN